MTNRQKAESCGEFVRDGIDSLHDRSCRWAMSRDMIVDGARQAGHWGRLALTETCQRCQGKGLVWMGDLGGVYVCCPDCQGTSR